MSTTMVSVTVIDSDGASDIAAPAGTTVAGLCAMLAIDLTEPSVRLSYADGRPLSGGAVLGRDLAAGSVIALSSRVLSAQQVNEASARQENQWLSPVLALVGFSFLLLAAASALCLLPTLGDAALRELTYAEDGPAWARAASSIPVWARGLCALVCMIGATTPLFCSRRVRSHPIMLLLLPALVGYSMIGLVPLAGIHALSVAPVVGVWSALIVTLAVASLTGAPSALSAIIAWGAATLLVTIHAYPLFALIDIAPLAVMIGVLLFLMSPRLALRVPDNQLIDSASLQTIASRIRQPPASAPSTLTGERIATVLSYTSARNTVLLVAASLFVLVGGIPLAHTVTPAMSMGRGLPGFILVIAAITALLTVPRATRSHAGRILPRLRGQPRVRLPFWRVGPILERPCRPVSHGPRCDPGPRRRCDSRLGEPVCVQGVRRPRRHHPRCRPKLQYLHTSPRGSRGLGTIRVRLEGGPVMPDTTTTRFAPAPASRLIGAYIIDLLILGTLMGATWFVYFTPLTITLISAEAVVASAIMLGASGRTPGMAAMRVCLIRDSDDAQTPSLGAAAGYTALTALLQVTLIGPLAALTMVRDGRTWLTGPTGTRLVDLRAHAALALTHSDQASESLERARSAHASSGFESVQSSPPGELPEPTAPLPTPPEVSLPVAPLPSPPEVSHSAAPSFTSVGLAIPPPMTAPRPHLAPLPSAMPSRAPAPPPNPALRNTGLPDPTAVGAAPRPPAPASSSPVLWIIFDSGQCELIDAPLAIGRSPASDDGSRAVHVPDTTLSLSRTHLRLGPTANGAWLEDLFSANGTQIRTPDGRITTLAGGKAVEVPVGTEIILGERRATIVHADADNM